MREPLDWIDSKGRVVKFWEFFRDGFGGSKRVQRLKQDGVLTLSTITWEL